MQARDNPGQRASYVKALMGSEAHGPAATQFLAELVSFATGRGTGSRARLGMPREQSSRQHRRESSRP